MLMLRHMCRLLYSSLTTDSPHVSLLRGLIQLPPGGVGGSGVPSRVEALPWTGSGATPPCRSRQVAEGTLAVCLQGYMQFEEDHFIDPLHADTARCPRASRQM